MKPPVILIIGTAAGLVGATLWALIGYFTGYEVGYVAWGVGVLVGLGVGLSAGDDADLTHGVLASVIALLSIAAGKFAVIHVTMNDAITSVSARIEVDDTKAIRQLARDLIPTYDAARKELKWRNNTDAESAKDPEDFPTDLWADALKQWNSMRPDDQKTYKAQLTEFYKGELAGAVGGLESKAFTQSFHLLDLLWAFLAVGSAFRLGTGTSSGNDD